MNPFYRFTAEAGDEPTSAELLIFSVIGDWDDMGEQSAKAFAHDLARLPSSVKRIDLHINSPGGSLFEASAIYSRLADHRSEKIVFVDGLAASAASIIAMVGHKIYIRANGSMMIHLPMGIAMGNADDMRSMAGALDTVTESMINVYAKRTGQERQQIRDWLAAETWMSPDQAVTNGFADEVRGVVKAAAIGDTKRVIVNGAEFDLSRFKHLPALPATTAETKPMKKPKVTATATDDPPPDDGNGNGDGDETPTPPVTTTANPPGPTVAPGPPITTTPPASQPRAATDYDRGVTAERERVQALQELDRPSTHDIIVAAIKDGKQPSDVFKACMDAMDKANSQNARRVDAKALDGIPASDGTGDDGSDDFSVRLKSAVKAKLKQRGQHIHSRN